MSLVDLPNELILEIWDDLRTTGDMNALACTCHYFYAMLNDRLYQFVANQPDLGNYCFHWAAEHNSWQTVSQLLETGVDPSIGDILPLHPAARYGRINLLQILLDYGFDPNAEDNHGQTPLHHAAADGHAECAGILLDSGAELDCPDKFGSTPSAFAVIRGHAGVLAILFERGASMAIDLPQNENPLGLAARRGHEAMVTFLLEKGFAVDRISGEMPGTPLAWAARTGRSTIVKQLLEAGANINATFHDGQGPLHWAALAGYEDTVALLLKHGAAADMPDHLSYTPLCRACSSRSLNVRVVKLLLKANVNVNAQSSTGLTPLAIAAKRGFPKAVRCLLQHGADPTIADIHGTAPIIIAAASGNPQSVLELLDHYAPSNPLTEVCNTPSGERMSSLKRMIDTTDQFNRTPLFIATLYGYEEIVRILLNRGSSAMNFATSAGRTALSIAREFCENARGSESDLQSMHAIWECLRDPKAVQVDLAKVQAASKVENEGTDVVCDSCSYDIPLYDTHFHCGVCNQSDFDLCLECFAGGQTCLDSTHVLQLLRMVDGRWSPVS